MDSSLEAVAGLDAEHASAAPRLADAEAAACEAAEVAAGLARAERAAAEAARLRHRMAETELALRSRALLEVELQDLARRAPEIEEAVGRSRAELRAARDAAALAEADLAFAAKGGVPRAGVMAAE